MAKPLPPRGPRRAMGDREQDFLELRNAWAHVTVFREDGAYYVDGEAECPPNGFARLEDAMSEAWRVLSLYADGRCD